MGDADAELDAECGTSPKPAPRRCFSATDGAEPNLSRVGALLWEAILLGPTENRVLDQTAAIPPSKNPNGHCDQVLQMLQHVGRTAPREVAARLGWSRSTTQRVLTALLAAGRVERLGTTRSISYRLSAGGQVEAGTKRR